jgi:hypothetical protein
MSIFNVFKIDCRAPLGLITTAIQETDDYISDMGYTGTQIIHASGSTKKGAKCDVITFENHDYKFRILCAETEPDMYEFSNKYNIKPYQLFEEDIQSDNYDTDVIIDVLHYFFDKIYEIDPQNNSFFGADNYLNEISLNYNGPKTFVLSKGQFKLKCVEEDEEEDDIDLGAGFKVKIMDWFKENPELVEQTKSLSLEEKMNFVGKYLIKEKKDCNISSQEFIDLFMQPRLFGFSEPGLIHFYELLK